MADPAFIQDVPTRNQFTAAAAQTVFDYTFPIFDQVDLVVEKTRISDGVTIILVLTTDYTVTGVGAQAGGTIVLTSGAAAGDIITITRQVELKRITDYSQEAAFNAANVNLETNRIVQMIQDRDRDIAQALRIPDADLNSPANDLPDEILRAGKVLAFNPSSSQPEAGVDNSLLQTLITTSLTSLVPDPTVVVASFTAARAIDGNLLVGGEVVLITELRRGGNFIVRPLVAQVDNDGTILELVTPNGFYLQRLGIGEDLNVFWFGAVGDGVAVDHLSIQNTIDALPSQGGRVLFPGGTFRLSGQVTAPPRVWLLGAGENATRLNAATGLSPFKFIDPVPSNLFEGGGMSGFSISLDNAAIGIECVDIWGLKFQGIRFRDGGASTGTLIKGSGICFEMKVLDCRLVGAQNFGIDLIDDCNSCVISRNDFALEDGAVSVRVKDTADCAILVNRFEYAGANAGEKVVVEDSVRTLIQGNLIQVSTSGYGVVLKGAGSGADKTIVEANGFATSGVAGCIDVITGDMGGIHNNTFTIDSTSGDMIRMGGRFGYSITGNKFEISTSFAGNLINFNSSAQGCSFSGNTAFGTGVGFETGTFVIIEAGSTFITVTGNTATGLDNGIVSNANNGTPTIAITGNSNNLMGTAKIVTAVPASNTLTGNI